MNCPVDETELRITDRQGIEIDYCPKCRGVWLDRGELDKLIDRVSPAVADDRDLIRSREDRPRARDGEGRDDRGYDRDRDSDRDRDRYRERDDDDDDRYRRKSKRKSLLGELFDID